MIDFSLEEGKAYINNDIELLKQQIDILFDTHDMEVLGDCYYGTDYEKFLYDLSLSAEAIERAILSDLYTINSFGYTPTVHVDLFQGTENDIILVKIDFTKDSDQYEFTFKIS